MALPAESPNWNNANHKLIERVDFANVLAQYSYNEDLQCKMKFDSYTPQEGDRVGIFKVGWELVKDYIVFEWVPFGVKAKEICVEFNRHILPKNEDIYQFCYVTGENELYGASVPFSFSTVNTPRSEPTNFRPQIDHTRNISYCSTDSDYFECSELIKLREENHILRECLKALLKERSQKNQNCDKHTELHEEMNQMKRAFVPAVQVQHELALLKQQFLNIEKGYKNLCQKMDKMLVQDMARDLTSKETRVRATSKSAEFSIDNLGSLPPFPFPK